VLLVFKGYVAVLTPVYGYVKRPFCFHYVMRVLNPRVKENTFLSDCEFTLLWKVFTRVNTHFTCSLHVVNTVIAYCGCRVVIVSEYLIASTPHLPAIVLGMYRADIKVKHVVGFESLVILSW